MSESKSDFMPVTIHAFALTASPRNYVRAEFGKSASKPGMKFDGWLDRMLSLIDADKRSDRALSLEAGLGENFVSQMRTTGRQPSVANFIKLTELLNASAIHILTGAVMDEEDELLLQYAVQLDAEHKRKLLDLMEALRGTLPGA